MFMTHNAATPPGFTLWKLSCRPSLWSRQPSAVMDLPGTFPRSFATDIWIQPWSEATFLCFDVTSCFCFSIRWPGQELLPPVRSTPSRPGPNLVSHTAEKLRQLHTSLLVVFVRQCVSLPVHRWHVFSVYLQGSGRHEQWWPNGYLRVLYRHETHQAETPGSPAAPFAPSQYETTPPAFTPTERLW